jgi:hypothetical protein
MRMRALRVGRGRRKKAVRKFKTCQGLLMAVLHLQFARSSSLVLAFERD